MGNLIESIGQQFRRHSSKKYATNSVDLHSSEVDVFPKVFIKHTKTKNKDELSTIN